MILRILPFIFCLLFSSHAWAQFTTPGMIPNGSFTLGDCLESAGGISVKDAGAACGSGGGSGTSSIVVTSSPYNASGFLVQTTTTGSNASGSTTINVANGSIFNIGQIAIVYQGGASQSPGHKNFAGMVTATTSTSITLSGTAVTGNGLPIYAPSSSGTSLITTVPANYLVFSVGTTTLANTVSSGATSITLTSGAGYKAGQGLLIYGGGVAGANLITTIQTITGNLAVISPGIGNASGLSSGAYIQHDDTAAIQAAVNVASYTQNVSISVPDGFYQINGPNTGTALNQISLPSLNYYPGCCGTPSSTSWTPQATIYMTGNTPATQSEGYLAGINMAPMTGAILQSSSTTSGGSMIGAYNSSSLANMTNIQFIVHNLTFRSYPNPQATMLNGTNIQEMSVYNSSCDTGETSQTTQPTSNNNNACIFGPGGDNGGNNVFSQLEIYGYYWGVQSGEHTRLEHIRFDNDYYPWLINTATGSQTANYGTTCVDLQFNGTPHGIASYGGAGTNVDCSLVNIEHQTSPSWVVNIDDISDSSNLLYGFIGIDSPLDSNTQTVTGGANLQVVNARSTAYPFSSYTYATLPSNPNGKSLYCSDCTNTSICAASGNGAYAQKLNGVWSCNGGNYDTSGDAVLLASAGQSVKLGTSAASSGITYVGPWAGIGSFAAIYLDGSFSTGNEYNFLSGGAADYGLYINRKTGYPIHFREENGSDQVTIASGGAVSVGGAQIGSSALSVYGTNGLALESASGSNQNLILFYNGSTQKYQMGWNSDGTFLLYDSVNNHAPIQVSTGDILYLDQSALGTTVGTTTPASGAELTVNGTVSATQYNVGTSQIAASNLSDGNTGTGNIVHKTSSTLVTPILGAASATSINFGGTALSAYQEGTWTPVITASTTAGTPAYSVQSGSYERIGRFVRADFTIVLSGWTGSPSGNASVTGLPYSAVSNGGCFPSYYNVSALATLSYGLLGQIASGSSVVSLFQNSNTYAPPLTAAQVGTTPNLQFECIYHL